MTNEQKAKAYEKALKIAQDIYHGNPSSATAITVCEEIFPELAENEDEKIRKTLIELVRCNERSCYTIFNNVTTSSMIAWLEKQGKNHIVEKNEMVEPTDKVEQSKKN